MFCLKVFTITVLSSILSFGQENNQLRAVEIFPNNTKTVCESDLQPGESSFEVSPETTSFISVLKGYSKNQLPLSAYTEDAGNQDSSIGDVFLEAGIAGLARTISGRVQVSLRATKSAVVGARYYFLLNDLQASEERTITNMDYVLFSVGLISKDGPGVFSADFLIGYQRTLIDKRSVYNGKEYLSTIHNEGLAAGLGLGLDLYVSPNWYIGVNLDIISSDNVLIQLVYAAGAISLGYRF